VPRTLTATQLDADLAVRDLTDPESGPHALQLLVDAATAALQTHWSCEVRRHRGARVVALGDNYDRLGFGGDAVTRDARYTRYIDDGHVLRSHTSAIVPEALRELASAPAAPPDVVLACPGICYRRDSIDRLHTGTPHQLDLWRVARHELGEADLEAMIAALCAALLPGRTWRTEPRVHPYTLSGRQVDVEHDGDWVEIAECGLAHPEVLRRAGLPVDGRPGDRWTGLALGMGLDRMLMLVKGITDIRLLRSTDERVSSQMLDLGPYRPVSAMPPIRRDLSVAVWAHDDAAHDDRLDEEIGDAVRTALAADASLLERVEVLSASPAGALPEAARSRLGILEGQVNLLVRITFRSLDRTLGDVEANVLRDRIFTALHEGTVATMAAQGNSPVLQGLDGLERPVG